MLFYLYVRVREVGFAGEWDGIFPIKSLDWDKDLKFQQCRFVC